ncbi:MAG TPA: FHA domain-containing serine/threonine-protein kinase [Anaerolineaceae bacterium]
MEFLSKSPHAYLLRPFSKKGIILIVVMLVLDCFGWNPALVSAQTKQTLQQAVRAGSLEAWGEPMGMAFQQPMVRLQISPRQVGTLVVSLPAGSQFMAPAGTTLANLVSIEINEITVSGSKKTVEVMAFSLSHQRGFPSATSSSRYELGEVHSNEKLVRLLSTIKSQGKEKSYGAQLAVWSVAESISLVELVKEPALQVSAEDERTASQLLGLPMPAATVQPGGTPPSGVKTPDNGGRQNFTVLAVILCAGVIGLIALSLVVFLTIKENRKQNTVSNQVSSEPNPPGSVPTGGQPSTVKEPLKKPGVRPEEKIIPKSTDAPARESKDIPAPVIARLTCVEGPLTGKTLSIRGECLISRGELEWMILDAPGVSAPHAAFDLSGEPYRLKDLRSTNGVLLDGEKLGAKFSNLPVGARIEIGKETLTALQNLIIVQQGSLTGKSHECHGLLVVASRRKLEVLVTGENDREISDAHAYIFPEGDGIFIKDLNSSRGSSVNDAPVTNPIALQNGDRLRLGGSTFIVRTNASPIDERLPRPFGGYMLHSILGEGGMGKVYLAENKRKELVAIKVAAAGQSLYQDRVLAEMRILKNLSHPNIVCLLDHGTAEGCFYLVMEYIEGISLAVLLENFRLKTGTVIHLISQVADALAYAHENKVQYHGDIKPSNILLDRQGKPYLTDFGGAREFEDVSSTQERKLIGSPRFMAPEQIDPKRYSPVDRRVDIYALGVVLYQAFTGYLPFDAEDSKSVLQMHLNNTPPDPGLIRQDLPDKICRVVLRCLQKNPTDRYPNVRMLKEDLGKGRVEDDLPLLISKIKVS